MTVRSNAADIAVIGAGSSCVAALKALLDQGVAVDCLERGSDVAGLWRYENDNGLSGARASLRTNVSRPRMQYPSFPMPCSHADFRGHREMAAYLDAYADVIRAASSSGSAPRSSGWRSTRAQDGGSPWMTARCGGTGLSSWPSAFWCPKIPTYPGAFGGVASHSHQYRTPGQFEGRRVLVVGAGQSAAEIAVEVSRLASRTLMAVRSRTHVLPRWIGGKP
jgi:dimethylaniline monooxygenase (N-oxide forming)